MKQVIIRLKKGRWSVNKSKLWPEKQNPEFVFETCCDMSELNMEGTRLVSDRKSMYKPIVNIVIFVLLNATPLLQFPMQASLNIEMLSYGLNSKNHRSYLLNDLLFAGSTPATLLWNSLYVNIFPKKAQHANSLLKTSLCPGVFANALQSVNFGQIMFIFTQNF